MSESTPETPQSQITIGMENALKARGITYFGGSISSTIRQHFTAQGMTGKEKKTACDAVFHEIQAAVPEMVTSASTHGYTGQLVKVLANNAFIVKYSPPTSTQVKAKRQSFKEIILLAMDKGIDPYDALKDAGLDPLKEIAEAKARRTKGATVVTATTTVTEQGTKVTKMEAQPLFTNSAPIMDGVSA